MKIMCKFCFNNKISRIIFILWLLLLLIDLPTVKSNCNENYEWQCDNGDFIDCDNRCDGDVNCKDGSDEIAEHCVHFKCPSLAFRCSYGGCIAGKKRCDGAKDCADNSDEMPLQCDVELRKQEQGNCGVREWQCSSGDECISDIDRCDGVKNCKDGSDETLEKCSHMVCSHYAFRCGYGGCVKGTAKCNNVADCWDSSDEAATLCNRTRVFKIATVPPTQETIVTPATPIIPVTAVTIKTVPPTKMPTEPPSKAPTKPPTDTSVREGAVCMLPTDHSNLIFNSAAFGELAPGAAVQRSVTIQFKCQPGYTRLGQEKAFCNNNGLWSTEIPICTKFCARSQLSMGVSTTIFCRHNGTKIEENAMHLPGTECDVVCSTQFEAPPAFFGNFNRRITCLSNGYWDLPKMNCIMQCGTVQSDATSFSKGGVNVPVTKVPWHVGIYNKFISLNRTCSGVIISPRLVVSAKHCFYDKTKGQLYNSSYFEIIAGTSISDFKLSDTALLVQRREVYEIFEETKYMYEEDSYNNDLVLVKVVHHFVFSTTVRPICIDFKFGNGGYVRSNIDTIFAGWGSDDSGRDDEGNSLLQIVRVKTMSAETCTAEIQMKNATYRLADDKFCIANKFGGTACRGDSGGGVYETQGKRSFLMGVISNAPLTTADCARDGVVAITNLQYFSELISSRLGLDRL